MFKINFVKLQSGININGSISKYKNFELEIETAMDSFRFGISLAKFQHSWNDLICNFNLVLGKWNINFNITDTRKWNESITLPEKGKVKCKKRRHYEKWFFTSQFLKLYNCDFLNNPYGITIDLAWFPFPVFTTLQLGKNPSDAFSFTFGISCANYEPWLACSLTFFSYKIEFEIGENTVLRPANLKYVDDFITLINRFANPYKEFMCVNIVEYQVMHRNLPYLWQVLNMIDVNKFDTDNILLLAVNKNFYDKEIFNLLLNHINSFNSMDMLDNITGLHSKDAILKLTTLPKKNNICTSPKSHRKFFKFDFKNGFFETFFALDGRTRLFYLLIQYEKWTYNLEFFVQLTRKYYSFFWITKSDKKFSWINFHKDGFSPIIIDFNFCGYFYQFMITEYHFNDMSLDWNYEKNRPYTTEELILINEIYRGENGKSSGNN